MSKETTKRVNCCKYGTLLLFFIEKDTCVGVLYAPFECVLMERETGVEPVLTIWETIILAAKLLSHALFPTQTWQGK